MLVALQMHNKLLELLDTDGIHRETESFSTDPRSALQHIKVNFQSNSLFTFILHMSPRHSQPVDYAFRVKLADFSTAVHGEQIN